MKLFLRIIFFLFFVVGTAFFAPKTQAATLSIQPPEGTFTVGGTFTVSLSLNTKDEPINAFEIFLKYPPDKLQIVSSGVGKSITQIWIQQPKFNNQDGTIELRGGIPGGIITDSGQIASFTFRVRGVGDALVTIGPNSRVFKNDGKATDVLQNVGGGLYHFILPPPAGPEVISPTHPDQSLWYSSPSPLFVWSGSSGERYSYITNQSPLDIPDDISEGADTNIAYRNLASGSHYFHIKAAVGSTGWGGVTHYAVNIDTDPPAIFPIEITPSRRTTQRRPILNFGTTDQHSGLDRYELKIIPLFNKAQVTDVLKSPLFVEVQSPYVLPELDLGAYDIIVRAYDKAGNYREVTGKLNIVTAFFEFIGSDGIVFRSRIVITWPWVWGGGFLLLLILLIIAWETSRFHKRMHARHLVAEAPVEIKQQLDELQAFRKKYGHLMVLFALGSLFVYGLGSGIRVLAQGDPVFSSEGGPGSAQSTGQLELSPPIISVLSRNVSNNEIFYVGGRIDSPGAEITLFLQDIRTGETSSYAISAERSGEWFYRHGTFLSPGNYIVWAKTRIADFESPPSPQYQMTVQAQAFQVGSSRVSYAAVYLTIIVALLLATLSLILFIIYHGVNGKKKERLVREKMREMEESIRRGFAVLRRDIEQELLLLRDEKAKRQFSPEEDLQEKKLLEDLEKVKTYLGKEIWEIEEAIEGHTK